MKRRIDTGSFIVIIVTFIFFTLALFTKGLTHDILLEAGILLVSVKLIIMGCRTAAFHDHIISEIKKLNDCLNKNT